MPEAGQKPPPKPRFGHDPAETWRVVRGRVLVRLARALDYLSIYLFVLVVYGGAVLADYLFFEFLTRLLEGVAKQSPFVASVLHFFKVGLALLSMLLGAVHAGYSAYSQWQTDRELSREG